MNRSQTLQHDLPGSDSIGYLQMIEWLQKKGRTPFLFQTETWAAIEFGYSGMVNAPTGYGKTYALLLGFLIRYINQAKTGNDPKPPNGLMLLWISPLRALSKDITRAIQETIDELQLPLTVGMRNGDTPTAERARQSKEMPNILVITPESLHLLLAQSHYPERLKNLNMIVADEWHELLGSKRGVLVELALSRLIPLCTQNRSSSKKLPLLVWGLSATIGNLHTALEVLTACLPVSAKKPRLIRAKLPKPIRIESIIPDVVEKYPWAGHMGLKLSHRIPPLLAQQKSTLVFINTRGMSETWYQELLNQAPELAGSIALHHSSIDQPLRIWVEEALHAGTLSAVVCTASLDLGVDFRPVTAVVQVGSPKGVARFLQRAGRSGHQPGAESLAYFLPTHALELLEAAALKEAIREGIVENREPYLLCFDVLAQYLCTLAVGEGFDSMQTWQEVQQTYCFRYMQEDEWKEVLFLLTRGGKALSQYDDFQKLICEEGICRIKNRKTAMRHRLSIGTIVSDAMLKVKQQSGTYIGVIEEYFISRLNPGDVFTLAGRNWEFIQIRDLTVSVRKSAATKSLVPSWMGGRMPLSANLGKLLRKKLSDITQMSKRQLNKEPELKALLPLIELQQACSYVPREAELLIELIETKDGYHAFVYPFEGRLVHEALAALLAKRLGKIKPITFSFVMNDYGFELLSDQPIPIDENNVLALFSTDNLLNDLQEAVNEGEMAKRKFRDIAVIGGLLFQGMPGEPVKQKHLQSSASLLFEVFKNYDPSNILLRQAYREVMEQQMEEQRLRETLSRIQKGTIHIKRPEKLTPFCFPIKVDSLRETLSSEQLEQRIARMIQEGK